MALLTRSAVASVAAWTGAPLLAVWVGSRLQTGTQPKMEAVAGVVLTLAVCELILVSLLSYFNERYDEISGRRKPTRVAPPWYSSMRGEREVQVRRDEGVTPDRARRRDQLRRRLPRLRDLVLLLRGNLDPKPRLANALTSEAVRCA